MAKAVLNEDYSDAVAHATLLQQTAHQKMKLRAFFSAARTLQCSLRCFRARRAARLRTAVKDAENSNRKRLEAADTMSGKLAALACGFPEVNQILTGDITST